MNKGSWVALVIALGAATAGVLWYMQQQDQASPDAANVETLAPVESPAIAEAPQNESPDAAEPGSATQDESAAPGPAAEQASPAARLPSLDESDAPLHQALGDEGLNGFDRMLAPTALIRRIVAVVDNLDRDPVRAKLRPLKGPTSAPIIAGEGDEMTWSPENADRYSDIVDRVAALKPDVVVKVFEHFEPLFDEAYEQLGYPNARFRPRLIAVIDHLLATPRPEGPLRLVRPKDLYEFADPALEQLSWGQKMLLRIGPANAEVVKDQLRAVRARLAAGAAPG